MSLLFGLGWAGDARAGYASIVLDSANGRILNAVNSEDINHPASLTKMMTIYLALEALHEGRLSWNQRLPVSAWAANKSPTKLDLRPGQTITVHDCILGMITKSANDAATVVAEGLGGTESGFAAMMNRKARELGMTRSYFVNASGLPDMRQVTTAHDLLRLSMALYHDFPTDAHLFATREFMFRGQMVHGHNHLMDRYPGMDGIKTGFTDASGFNLASTAVRDNHRLFAVVMGGRSAAVRDNLMARLLDNSFADRPTSPILVAEAAGVSPRHARSLLAAFSPIETADADELDPGMEPRSGHHHRRGHIVHAGAAAARWGVQVGTFHDRAHARHASLSAVRVAHLGGHGAQIVPTRYLGHRGYSARINGLSQHQAQAACSDLRHHHLDCAVLRPSRSGIRLASE